MGSQTSLWIYLVRDTQQMPDENLDLQSKLNNSSLFSFLKHSLPGTFKL